MRLPTLTNHTPADYRLILLMSARPKITVSCAACGAAGRAAKCETVIPLPAQTGVSLLICPSDTLELTLHRPASLAGVIGTARTLLSWMCLAVRWQLPI